MKLKGTILLSIISLLERLSYYGVRAILLLYLLDLNFLNINEKITSEFYRYWSYAILVFAIPFSLITDRILGQKKSIILGGILSCMGYVLLIFQNQYTFILGIILLLAGTSLVKPSTTILVGRQFKKENKNRTLAYMIFFSGINIGAFLGIVIIGFIGEEFEWKYGFLIAAFATLLYVILASFFIKNVDEIESNQLESNHNKVTWSKSVFILTFIVLISVIFWTNYNYETSNIFAGLMAVENKTFFGFTLLNSAIESLLTFWAIPATILLFIYWSIKGVTNTIKAIVISLTLLILAVLVTRAYSQIQPNYIFEWSLLPLAIYAMAEVFISPLLTSYVTRVSDTAYSNTIYSIYKLICYILGIGFVSIFDSEYQLYITMGTLVFTILAMIIFKKKLSNLALGLK